MRDIVFDKEVSFATKVHQFGTYLCHVYCFQYLLISLLYFEFVVGVQDSQVLYSGRAGQGSSRRHQFHPGQNVIHNSIVSVWAIEQYCNY